MTRAAPPWGIVVTAPYEPRARSPQARTKAGALRKKARRWRSGLTWSAKLQLLDARLPLQPPYDVTVHGHFPPSGPEGPPALQDWFEAITSALSDALWVDSNEIRLRPGRVGYTVPFSPPHFEIVITGAGVAPPLMPHVTCPVCSAQWTLDPVQQDDDRCPHCGHEAAGLPFILGLL